ncbi:hypothetical protein, partial [Corynebacterium sp. HMSC077D03]|uniref:hypothetical protein n=1 Tax=Corynebacterium sp. HMSC077D03 TaxID=1739392 RepID=UPI001AEF4D6E
MAGTIAYQVYASATAAQTEIRGLSEKPSALPINTQQIPTTHEYANIIQKNLDANDIDLKRPGFSSYL